MRRISAPAVGWAGTRLASPMRYVQAIFKPLTLAGVICVTGE